MCQKLADIGLLFIMLPFLLYGLLRQMVFSAADALGLRPAGIDFLDEFHFIALLQFIERRTDDVFAMKIQLCPVLIGDETEALLVRNACDMADMLHDMNLGFSPQAMDVILQLPPCGIESIAQRNVRILIVAPVYDNFVTRHAEIDAYIEFLALLLMAMRHFHYYAARNNMGKKIIQFLHLFADVCFQRF
jgi:hypothetical protein